MIAYSEAGPGEDLARLQRVLVRMTDQIIRYCGVRSLDIVLVAGSALGAVRHGAVIPWDDDIDLGMPRADFDRFIAEFQADPVPGMMLQSWQTEADYPYSFAKVRLDGTRIDEVDFAGKQLHSGIFVDIFPYDDVPANPLLERLQRYGVGLLNLFIERPESDEELTFFSPRRRFARWVAQRLAPLLPGPQRFAAWRDSVLRMRGARKSGQVDCLGMFGANSSHRTRIDASAIFPPVPARLGECAVLVPGETDTYLTKMYRDWRKLPPVDQRVPLHIRSVDFCDHPLSQG